MTLLFSVILTIISTIGLLFNAYTILVILLTRQVNTANNILLLHLGSVNTVFGGLFLIFCLPGIKGTEWARGGVPCYIDGFLFTLFQPLAVWTICGLNCDRYYAIAAPLHYTHIVSSKKVLIGLLMGWINSFLLAVPPLFNSIPYEYLEGLNTCTPKFRTGSASLWYTAGYTVFTLLVPATVFVCCNTKILLIARYHRHRIASAIFQVALSAQATITHQRNLVLVPAATPLSKLRGSNPVLSMFLLVVSFLFVCLPYYVVIVYEAYTMASYQDSSSNKFYIVAGTLLVCSPAVNGYIYGLKNKNLRKAFMNYWRKKRTKNEVHHEIQARTPSTCGSRKPSLNTLGMFSKNPAACRRMSETHILDKSKTKRLGIKRITSELMWRHSVSANSLNLSPKDEMVPPMKQTISCNTLRVPEEDGIKPAGFLNKMFTFDPANNPNTGQKSPKILITRATSEESDRSGSPTCDVGSASNLVDPNQEEIKSPDSSETSCSSGRLFMTFQNQLETVEATEDALLLQWNSHKKYRKPEDARRKPNHSVMKVTVHSKEIVL